MRYLLILFFIGTFAPGDLFAQLFSKSAVYGTYEMTTGQPGRTIKKSDSSEIHLMPVTYTETLLKIKRFGRAKMTITDFRMDNMRLTYKYKWRIEVDTLIIWPKRDKTEEQLIMTAVDGSVRYLSPVNKAMGYSIRME
jgi:hypothetical protein